MQNLGTRELYWTSVVVTVSYYFCIRRSHW